MLPLKHGEMEKLKELSEGKNKDGLRFPGKENRG